MKKILFVLILSMLIVCFGVTVISAEEKPELSYPEFADGVGGAPNNAVVLGAGAYYAVHFNTTADFIGIRIAQWTPGSGAGEISYVLSVFEWNRSFDRSMDGKAVAEVEGVSTKDDLFYDVLFDKTVPAGNYVVVLEIIDINESAAPGMHVQSGTIHPGQEDCFEAEDFGSLGAHGDRYATFKLIVEGKVDESCFTALPEDPTEEPTEVPEETPAPETTAVPTAAATAAPTDAPTEAPEESSGCGSVIGGSITVLAVMSAAALVLRKKETK